MAIDASIYGLLKPAAPPPDPMEQYGKMMTLGNMMGQQEVQGLQTQQLRTGMADDLAIRDAYRQSGGDAQKALHLLSGAGQYKAVESLRKSLLDDEVKRAGLTKTNLEADALKHARVLDDISRASSDADMPVIRATVERLFGPEMAASIPQTFDRTWQRNAVMTGTARIADMKPNRQVVGLGGKSDIVEMNPNAVGYNPNVDLTHTQSPDSVASITAQAEQGKLNRDVTMRGQNMTDVRSRENAGLTDTGGLTAQAEAMAQGIASGQIAPLSGFALNRPGGRAVMGRVMEINPQYDAAAFSVRSAGEKGFLSKNGPQIRGFNVVVDHLDTAQNLYNAMRNGNVQAINTAKNAFEKQFGQAAPTNLESAKRIIAAEAVRAVTGAAGALGDREEMQKALNTNLSDSQFLGTVNTIKELAMGQMEGHEQQYKSIVGDRGDFAERFLTGKSKAMYAARKNKTSGDAPKPPVAAPTGRAKFLGFEKQ